MLADNSVNEPVLLEADVNFIALINTMYALDNKVNLNLNVDPEFKYNFFAQELYLQILNRPDILNFIHLLDIKSEQINWSSPLDGSSLFETREALLFLSYVETSEFFSYIVKYLKSVLDIKENIRNKFLGFMYDVWFNKRLESNMSQNVNGFGHTFVGYQISSESKPSGLHSWVKIYLLSQNKQQYFSITQINPILIDFRTKLSLTDKSKQCTSFNGTSPLFTILLYTLSLIYCKFQSQSPAPADCAYVLLVPIQDIKINITIVERSGMILTAYPSFIN